jgi:methylenetetrahydrofolate dehydrogenase (NADP+)/methenyltetrahydrofolate cyclohydrolase
MGLELLLAGCTVTTAHKFTACLEDHVRAADVVVAATGRPGLVRGEWIKPGAIVIDVGITRGSGGKLQGDVDFAGAVERASWITPVPGGVGPMTRIAMLQNTLYAADHFHSGS